MTLLLNAVVLNSTHENCYRITFVSKNTVDLWFYMIYQSFLSHRLCSLYRLSLQSFQRKDFCIFKNIFYSIIMVIFGMTKIAKVLCWKKPIKNLDINADNIVISNSVKTKTSSKYLIWYLDKDMNKIISFDNA